VRALLVAEHPALLTVSELIRELAQEDESFSTADSVRRAIRDLTGAGLLSRQAELVVPTRAARHFEELEL
jgi:hypothetical protein